MKLCVTSRPEGKGAAVAASPRHSMLRNAEFSRLLRVPVCQPFVCCARIYVYWRISRYYFASVQIIIQFCFVVVLNCCF